LAVRQESAHENLKAAQSVYSDMVRYKDTQCIDEFFVVPKRKSESSNENAPQKKKSRSISSSPALTGSNYPALPPFQPLSLGSDVQSRLVQLANELQISSVTKVCPDEYYKQTLEWRRDLLGAPHVDHLCKSVIMQNTKCKHTNYDDWLDSKYYLVIVQYTARLNNEKLVKLLRDAQAKANREPIGKKNFNFRLCPADVSQQLTGFGHNAVSPIGTTHKLPVIMSDKVMAFAENDSNSNYIWLGGGEVNLKWRVGVKEFVRAFNPVVHDVTY